MPAGDRLCGGLREVLVPGAGVEETGAALSRVIAPVVAHDALRLMVMNPSLGVGASALGFWHGYGPDLGRELMRVGSRGAAFPQLARLARQTVPVVADRGLRAGWYDRLLARYGFGEELCLVLRDGRGVWGLLGLKRAAGGRPFGADDTHRIAGIGPPLIAALRSYVTQGPVAPTGQRYELPPGMLVVSAEGEVAVRTPQARKWQSVMARQQAAPDWLIEYCFAALSFEAREHARNPSRRYPRVCTPLLGYGQWTAFEAQPLGDNGDIAIMIQRATGTLLLPTFCDWHKITAREQQVVQHLQDGSAPKQIARLLDLSVHTVNDHLGAIFRKTGACGRDELMAAITA
ncbi:MULTISPECIES: helix-turn-helix transcriptional regulator [unclassified Streptomyces]|uniref:Helix-turn-helix transcriptional regulator n=1 Tax=Streptomyces sp. NBC_00060 TaxID=2975636 RepID=A0AAU2GRF4_9ACTN